MSYGISSSQHQPSSTNPVPISSTSNTTMIESIECTLRETSNSQSPYDEQLGEIFFTKRTIESGKVFNLENLRHRGWDITPFLVRQTWENFLTEELFAEPLEIPIHSIGNSSKLTGSKEQEHLFKM